MSSACLLVLFVLYVISYSPVYALSKKYVYSRSYTRNTEKYIANWDMYSPVNYLIDNTPLRAPLFTWASLWGVERDFRIGSITRDIKRLPIEHFTQEDANE